MTIGPIFMTAYFGKKWEVPEQTPRKLLSTQMNPSWSRTEEILLWIPEQGKKMLMNNPFGVDIMLSDLISSENIDDNVSNGTKWLCAPSQLVADNVEILNQGIWHTYWHDGTNKDVTIKARISARPGTGVAGSITQQDLSMDSKAITAMSNPLTGSNIVVTSVGHGLRSGFSVRILGVR